MILSKYAVCGAKKILLKIFIKNKEAKWVLSYLRLRTPLSKVTSLGDILF